MTRDDIIRLAVEAKLVCPWDGGCASAWVEGHDLTPYLERFAALVAKHERKWVGLNELEIRAIAEWEMSGERSMRAVVEEVEAQLKEKNT